MPLALAPAQVKDMLRGDADKLSSRFHLSYNMLLNCVRVETANIEQLISKSFYTFQLQRELPELEATHRSLTKQLTSGEMAIPQEVCARIVHLQGGVSTATPYDLQPVRRTSRRLAQARP